MHVLFGYINERGGSTKTQMQSRAVATGNATLQEDIGVATSLQVKTTYLCLYYKGAVEWHHKQYIFTDMWACISSAYMHVLDGDL